ncbi:MAG: DUF5818 domain-containing protein [Terriglobales bacterium]
MKQRNHSSQLATLGLLLAVALPGVHVMAQQAAAAPQSPSQAGQQSERRAPDQSARQAPDPQDQAQARLFAGTIKKVGDRYVLQEDNGQAFDIDRQDLAKPHEGQKVRISGTLDPDGKTIHVK